MELYDLTYAAVLIWAVFSITDKVMSLLDKRKRKRQFYVNKKPIKSIKTEYESELLQKLHERHGDGNGAMDEWTPDATSMARLVEMWQYGVPAEDGQENEEK